MNRIYRRIWSTTRMCWVVASELSAARGKSAKVVGTSMGLAAMLPLLGAVSEAHARSASFVNCHTYDEILRCIPMLGHDSSFRAPTATRNTSHYLSMGNGTHVDGHYTISFGHQTSAIGDRNAAFGYGVELKQGYSTGLGAYAFTDGIGATAVGNNSKAHGNNAVALGSGANTAAGSGAGRIAIGGNAAAGDAGYSGAVAIGANAKARYDSVVLGHDAQATASGAVALGRGSLASETNSVSVGNSTTKRRIVNVADARLGTTSTDAVTGKQLHATNQNVSAATNTANAARTAADQALANTRLVTQSSASSAIRVGGDNTGTVVNVANKNGAKRRIQNIANGVVSATSTDAITGSQLHVTNANVQAATRIAETVQSRISDTTLALGGRAEATGAFTTALGHISSAEGERAVAVGVRSRADGQFANALGSGARASGDEASAIGREAQATATYTTALGNSANASAASATALGFEAHASHAGAVALGSGSQTTDVNQISVGHASLKRRIVNLADGVVGSGSSDAITGNQLHATNQDVGRAQSSATAAQVTADQALGNTHALGGLISQTASNGAVRVGGSNTGTVLDVRNQSNANRKVSGVADGTVGAASTDAVNGRQLNAAHQLIDTHSQSLLLHGQQLAAHNQTLVTHDQRIGENRADIDQLRQDVGDFDPDLQGVVRFSADRSLVDMDGARVTGLAAGDIDSGASTDAVTGGQLFDTNQRVMQLAEQGKYLAVGTGGPGNAAVAGLGAVALGDSAKASITGEGGVALGSFALALGENSVALGRGTAVAEEAENGFALGTRSEVMASNGMALGAASAVHAGAARSVAIGSGSIADQADTVSFGNGLLHRRLVNIAQGQADADAVTVAQLRNAVDLLGGGAGLDASGNITSPQYAVQGAIHGTVGDALSALDGAVVAADARAADVHRELRSVFADAPSVRADGTRQLLLAGGGADGMVLSNVASGVIGAGSRDAVNGGQLHALQQRLDGRIDGVEQRIEGQAADATRRAGVAITAAEQPAAAPVPVDADVDAATRGNGVKGAPQVAAAGAGDAAKTDAAAPAAQVDTAELERMLARVNERTDNAVSGLERRLDKIDKRFNRMAAMSSAQSAMAMNTAGLATYNRLGAGVGHSDGESALAVGYQRVLNQHGSATFSLNGAFTNSGEQSVGVGVGIGW